MTTPLHNLCILHPPSRSHGQRQQQPQCPSTPFPPSPLSSLPASCPILATSPTTFSATSVTLVTTPYVYTTAASAMQLLDMTTVHGLLLYTLYLLHRLGFFHRRYARKWTVFFHRLALTWQQRPLRLTYLAPLSGLDPRNDDNPIATETQKQEQDPSVTRDGDSTTSSSEQSSVDSFIDDCSVLDDHILNNDHDPMKESIRVHSSPPSSSRSYPRTNAIGQKLNDYTSINDRIPAEILLLVFDCLASHPRIVLKCMLVCRSWYELIGPHVWRSPRILWSRHWSRFLPIASVDSFHLNDYDYRPIATEPRTAGSINSRVIPPRITAQVRGDFEDGLEEVVTGSDLLTDLSYSVGSLSPRQQHTALMTSSHLHSQDQEEIKTWLLWRKREKAKQAYERARRRRWQIKKHRECQLSMQLRGEGNQGARRRIPSVQDGSSSPEGANTLSDFFEYGESGQNRRDSGIGFSSPPLMSQGGGQELYHPYDEGNLSQSEDSDDQHEEQEQENSLPELDDESDSDFGDLFDRLSHSDDGDHGIYGENNSNGEHFGNSFGGADWQSSWKSNGDMETEESEYDSSDDETPLMKLVSGVDYLYSFMRGYSQPTSPSLASSSAFSSSTLSLSPSSSSYDVYHRQETIFDHSERVSLTPSSASALNRSHCSVFSRTLTRIRRHQANVERRRRLSGMRHWDRLPSALPLQTCGRWIQVVNLQKETLYPQKVDFQLSAQQLPVFSRRHNLHQHPSNVDVPEFETGPQHHTNFFASLFGGLRRQPMGFMLTPTSLTLTSTESVPGARAGARRRRLRAQDPPLRLLTRRECVTDRTLATILEYCPGLCRLTLSECYNITDEGLALIRDSACVARRTLVSLHLAGCWRITDQGIQSLLVNNSAMASLQLESIDMAGCFQVTDAGLMPLLRQCGSRLLQLRVSDCELVTMQSVTTLVQHCHRIQWLDLARSGLMTDGCLKALAAHCPSLEWLNLARAHPDKVESVPSTTTEAPIASGSGSGGSRLNSSESGLGSLPGSQVPIDPIEHGQHQFGNDNNNQYHEGGNKEEVINAQDEAGVEEIDSISDESIALLGESCPNLQLLDLSYITSISNAAIESLSESAHSLVCLTIIGCSGITSEALLALARLRHRSGKLGCITMGDALGISESDIELIMQGSLNGWQKSLVDETNLGEILGRSWDE